MKLCKEVLAGMVLDYKDKFDTTLMNINKELTGLRNKFTKLESDLAIGKTQILEKRTTFQNGMSGNFGRSS